MLLIRVVYILKPRGLMFLVLSAVLVCSLQSQAFETAGLTSEQLEIAQSAIDSGVYMEDRCQPVEFRGWPGFPTIRCSYRVRNSVRVDVVLSRM
ncbi:MAG: hypothetical protein HRT45_14400 [Bdellovibrionales bacterium]|nr:hypothetical protein [Bdellovibrionales bacterium]